MHLLPGFASANIGKFSIAYDFLQLPPGTPSTSASTSTASDSHDLALLEQASQHIAHLLGSIAAPQHHLARLQQQLQQLAADTQDLQTRMVFDANGSGGAACDEPNWRLQMLVRERSIVLLRHMTPAQRAQVLQGWLRIKTTELGQHPLLIQVQQAIKESLLRNLWERIQPDLLALLSKADNNTLTAASANHALEAVKQAAQDLLIDSGFAHLPAPHDLHTLSQLLLEGMISYYIDTQALQHGNTRALENVGKWFKRLSLQNLQAFFSVREATPAHNWLDIAGQNPFLFAEENIATRVTAWHNRLMPALIALTERPMSLTEPTSWQKHARNFTAGLRQTQRLQAFVRAHMPSLGLPFAAMRQEVCAVLDDALRLHRSRLHLLDMHSLRLLQHLAKTSHCTSMELFVQRAMAFRPLREIYDPLISKGLELAIQGNVLGLFQHINAANALAIKLLQRLHIRSLSMPSTSILQDLYGPPMDVLSDTDLRTLHAVLHSHQTLQVLEALSQAGQILLETRSSMEALDSHKGQQCLDRVHEFALLQQASVTALQSRHLQPQPLPAGIVISDAHAVLAQGFGVNLNDSPPPGYVTVHQAASPALQAIWNAHLAQLVATPTSTPPQAQAVTTLPHGGQVDPAFIKELNRLVHSRGYTYTNTARQAQPLVPKASTRTQQAQTAYDTLLSLNASPAAITAATHCARQAIFKAVLNFWTSDDNPIATSQRAKLMPIFPHAITHYHFYPGPENGLYLRVEYGAYAFEQAIPLDENGNLAQSFAVDPSRSYFHLCSKLYINAQGQVSIHIPLRITANLAEDDDMLRSAPAS